MDEINTPPAPEAAGEIQGAAAWACPECGEPVINIPPRRWPGALGSPPAWSHLDGEPLCPIVGPNGYQPATPERVPS